MRVVVTGLGVISPLARGAAATMDRILAGECAIRQLALFSLEGCRSQLAAEVADVRVSEVAPAGEDQAWSRVDAMSVLAVREALAQAGADGPPIPTDLIIGGTTAGMFETEKLLTDLLRDVDVLAPWRLLSSHPLSSTADHVCRVAGPFRSARTLCSACTGGINAILLGASWIATGRSRRVVAGGADGLSRLTFSGFDALSALSPEPARPFDRSRAGLSLGEGAAFMVLESEDDARARGARAIVELRGWAIQAEAHHITNPEPDGATAARVMALAIARAGLSPSEIDYVNAHGTATRLNDAMETTALRTCLGAEVERIFVSSSKGQLGHALAAAGAIEAAIVAMAIVRGKVPPTGGLCEPDPACKLTHVMATRDASIRAAISNSFGFGGTDSALVVTAPDAFPEAPAAPRRDAVVTTAATVGPLGILGLLDGEAYLEPGPPPAPGRIDFLASSRLDTARARRLDRSARMITACIERASVEARLGIDPEASFGVGAVFGSAFGNIDATAAYMTRVFDKGARFASPADFPNLVPSSPVGHASIYLGLRGPVLATADLDASFVSAVATAVELIAAGQANAMFAGCAEQASVLIERCVGPDGARSTGRGPRAEGASVVLLEERTHALARNAQVVATVAWWTSWRAPPGWNERGCLDAPSPEGRARVYVARDDERIAIVLGDSTWARVPRHSAAPRAGDHEAALGFAAAGAIAAMARGAVDMAMVLGIASERGSAVVFRRQGPCDH